MAEPTTTSQRNQTAAEPSAEGGVLGMSDVKDRFGKAIDEARAGAQAVRDEALNRAGEYRDKLKGTSSEWIDEAKAYIRGSSHLGLESSISQAQRYSDGVVLGRFESLHHYLERIQALTAEDVLAVANKYLDPDQMTLVVLRPAGGGANGG